MNTKTGSIPSVLESVVEEEDVKKREEQGGKAYKICFIGRRGAPDRLHLMPIPEEHQEIVSKYIQFVEYKRPKGGRVSVWQKKIHKELIDLGFKVEILSE